MNSASNLFPSSMNIIQYPYFSCKSNSKLLKSGHTGTETIDARLAALQQGTAIDMATVTAQFQDAIDLTTLTCSRRGQTGYSFTLNYRFVVLWGHLT